MGFNFNSGPFRVAGTLAMPGIEEIPQSPNTIRLAVRFACGCQHTRDVPVTELGPDRAASVMMLGTHMVEILEKLNEMSESHHKGEDPRPPGVWFRP